MSMPTAKKRKELAKRQERLFKELKRRRDKKAQQGERRCTPIS